MRSLRTLLRSLPFYAPALALALFFVLVPMMSSFYYSLTDWNGLDPAMRFIGMENFRHMASDDMFLNGLRNTLIFALAVTVVQNTAALALAMAVDAPFHGKEAIRVAFFMPAVLSALVVGYSWAFILNPLFGALNALIQAMGLDFLVSDWLGDPGLALPSIVGITVWQFTGYSMVIYLAGMQGVPRELYEASNIDGAGIFRKFFQITFPLIAPSFTINVLLSMIGTMKVFDLIFVTTNGGPGYATETVATVLYNQAFQTNKMGYGTAIAVVLFVLIFGFSVVQMGVLRRREELS